MPETRGPRAVLLPTVEGAIRALMRVPSSKSMSNRGLIAAAAAGGGTIHNPLDCDDTRLLARALETCGWSLQWEDAIQVGARRAPSTPPRVDLGNSGTGSRLILSLLACSPGHCVVDGSRRLRERPMGTLLQCLRRLGARLTAAPGDLLPVLVEGRSIRGGRLVFEAGVSSQFVSSLLLAAPLMHDGLELELVGALPSRPYLDLTEDVLTTFGAEVTRRGDRWWRVAGRLRPTHVTVEGDWSAAAFFAAAAAVMGGEVAVTPLRENSRQGDRALCRILSEAGMDLEFRGEQAVFRGPVRRPLRARFQDCPDLFPALAVVAAARPGSRLSGLEHLKHKECDRLAVMKQHLERLGAGLRLDEGCLEVLRPTGVSMQRLPGVFPTHDDHRIAMALAVAALRSGSLVIDDAGCVEKSFPDFWQQWEHVGRLEPVNGS